MRGGHHPKGDKRLEEVKAHFNVARLKKGGENFEIVINPDETVAYVEGKINDIRQVVRSEKIFFDSQKGELASEKHMESIFGTNDALKVAEIILKEGEIQLTQDIREKHREKKKEYLIAVIAREAVDPQTRMPHPLARIKLAFDEAKIKVDEMKSADKQIDEIVHKLKIVLPIILQKKILLITIPSLWATKAQHAVRTGGKLINEEWLDDGSWQVELEISGGTYNDFKATLESATKGSVEISEVK